MGIKVLREFVESGHYLFLDKADNWQDAIRLSCKSIERDNTVDESYSEEIINCVMKYGPYIVLLPDVAMPHSQEGAKGVHKTAIAFMKVNQPVSFDDNDPEKSARLFFTLASCNPEQHLKNMTKLSELLMKEELLKELLKAESAEDLIELQKRYLD